jgi:hypothetical protein
MHNYVDLNYADKMSIQTPSDEAEYKGANRIAEDGSSDLMSKIQAQREADLKNITKNKPPMSF